MLLIDVNVLLYAHREDSANHRAFRDWLHGLINGDSMYGMSELVLSSFLRIATHPRIFDPPSTMTAALEFVSQLRDQPHAVRVSPGPAHWEIFTRFCQTAGATGNLVPDAYLAALAVESGCEWITTDRDYARFPGLRWRHPLE